MSQFENALADGEKAIEIDPTWAKGYFRAGKALQGLERYPEAYKFFEKGVKIDPENKELRKEMESSMKAADKKATDDAKAEKFEIAPLDKQYKPPTAAPVEAKDAPTKVTTKPAAAAKPSGDADADLRGYKILADGRKTSFFHHEMTEEERRLMGYGADGNLAPKALSKEEAAKMEKDLGAKAGANPVWAGNTWVDKKLDKWAGDKLSELLVGVSFQLPEKEGATLTVKAVKDWTGSASIYIKAGKARYLFDLNFKLDYVGEGLDLSGLCKVEGELKYEDILPDDVDEDEVAPSHKFTGDKPVGETLALANKHATKQMVGLQGAVLAALKTFSKEFHAYPLQM